MQCSDPAIVEQLHSIQTVLEGIMFQLAAIAIAVWILVIRK